MYCNNCGSQIAEGAAFCSHCGSAVSSNVQDNMKSQNGNMMYQNSGIQGTKKKGEYCRGYFGSASCNRHVFTLCVD